MAKISEDFEVAPLRTLNDFLLESARFQIPNFKDPEKWSNRIVQNLLYYQTNYFLTAIFTFLIVGYIHPGKMLYGFIALGVAYGLFYYFTNNASGATRFRQDHSVLSILIVVAGGYFIVYMLGSVLVFAFGIILPIFLVLLHASLRLRNLKNKITNKVEQAGIKRTPMGMFLISIGQDTSGIFSLIGLQGFVSLSLKPEAHKK